HDDIQNGTEAFLNTGIRFNFTRQGFLQVATQRGHEAWIGRKFKTGSPTNVFGSVQAFRWLRLSGNFNRGWAIYYDPVNPFQGKSTGGGGGFTLQPNPHLQQDVDYSRVAFDRASDGQRVYTVHIINTESTYQFDKHLRVRLLEQFDSSRRQLLT